MLGGGTGHGRVRGRGRGIGRTGHSQRSAHNRGGLGMALGMVRDKVVREAMH
jgi:hypothetical protein